MDSTLPSQSLKISLFLDFFQWLKFSLTWLFPDLEELFFLTISCLWQPCFTSKMLRGKNFCPGNSDRGTCYNVHIGFFTFVLFAWKIKGGIETNIEMKSHLMDLIRNHFLNTLYMSCIVGKIKFSFLKPTLLSFLCLLLSPVHE